MFKVNIKNTRTTSMTTSFSSVSIADFEQASVSLVVISGIKSPVDKDFFCSQGLKLCQKIKSYFTIDTY